MFTTRRRKPRLSHFSRLRPFGGQADSNSNDYYVDDEAGLLAIPIDVARVYRQLPLSATK